MFLQVEWSWCWDVMVLGGPWKNCSNVIVMASLNVIKSTCECFHPGDNKILSDGLKCALWKKTVNEHICAQPWLIFCGFILHNCFPVHTIYSASSAANCSVCFFTKSQPMVEPHFHSSRVLHFYNILLIQLSPRSDLALSEDNRWIGRLVIVMWFHYLKCYLLVGCCGLPQLVYKKMYQCYFSGTPWEDITKDAYLVQRQFHRMH